MTGWRVPKGGAILKNGTPTSLSWGLCLGNFSWHFFPFSFRDSVLLTFPHHNPSHSISQAQTFIKFISLGVYEYDQYLLSYKWSLMKWRVFLGSSVSQQEKSIFVQEKKKKKAYIQTLTKQQRSLFQRKLRGQKLGKFVQGHPPKPLRQPGASLIWPVDWVKIDFTQTGSL